jgi:hypothetical protein
MLTFSFAATLGARSRPSADAVPELVRLLQHEAKVL